MKLKLESLTIQNLGPLHGKSSIQFADHVTVIVGPSGSGKTAIFEAISSLGSPVSCYAPHVCGSNDGTTSEIRIDWNTPPRLASEFKELIFHSEDDCHGGTYVNDVPSLTICRQFSAAQLEFVRHRAEELFVASTYSSWSSEEHSHRLFLTAVDGTSQFATGESILIYFAFVLAIREAAKLDVPLILDSPYGCLDSEKRAAFYKILMEHKSQLIILVSETEISYTPHTADYYLIPATKSASEFSHRGSCYLAKAAEDKQ